MSKKIEQFITFTPKEDKQYSYLNVLNINNGCIIRHDSVYTKLENASVTLVEIKDNDVLVYGEINTEDDLQFIATVTLYGTTINKIYKNTTSGKALA